MAAKCQERCNLNTLFLGLITAIAIPFTCIAMCRSRINIFVCPYLRKLESLVLSSAEQNFFQRNLLQVSGYQSTSRTNVENPYGKDAAKKLLSEIREDDLEKICLVIDLDETLIYRTYEPIENADFIIPVNCEDGPAQENDEGNDVKDLYVLKRPYVDEFLQKMNTLFECILFTASDPVQAKPVIDVLDKNNVFRSRLYADATVVSECSDGNMHHVKDLSKLGRNLDKVVILDNNPNCYSLNPDNAIPIPDFIGDNDDQELLELIPFLERLSKVDNAVEFLKNNTSNFESNTNDDEYNTPNVFSQDIDSVSSKHKKNEENMTQMEGEKGKLKGSIAKELNSNAFLYTDPEQVERNQSAPMMQVEGDIEYSDKGRKVLKGKCSCDAALLELGNEGSNRIIIIQNPGHTKLLSKKCDTCFKDCPYCLSRE